MVIVWMEKDAVVFVTLSQQLASSNSAFKRSQASHVRPNDIMPSAIDKRERKAPTKGFETRCLEMQNERTLRNSRVKL